MRWLVSKDAHIAAGLAGRPPIVGTNGSDILRGIPVGT
jgi:hypothetical protein